MPAKEKNKNTVSGGSVSVANYVSTFDPAKPFEELIHVFKDCMTKAKSLPKDGAQHAEFKDLDHAIDSRKTSLRKDQQTLKDLWVECEQLASTLGSYTGIIYLNRLQNAVNLTTLKTKIAKRSKTSPVICTE